MIKATHRFLVLSAVFLALFFSSEAVLAQRCDADYEQIITFRSPDMGSYSVWDTVFGDEDKHELFQSALQLEDGDVLALGLRYARAGKDAQEGVQKEQQIPAELILAQVRPNGRVRWRQFHRIEGLISVVKLLAVEDGYLVLGNRRQAQNGKPVIWMGLFDSLGGLKSQSDISGAAGDLAYDITPWRRLNAKGQPYLSYLVAALAPDTPSSARLYTLNSKRQVASRQDFVTGRENRILSLYPLEDEEAVLASGYDYEDERKSGWILRLNKDGGIDWQQLYPRGAGAEVVKVKPYKKDYLIAVGTAAPAVDGGKQAGWVMLLRADNGELIWQRYFTGALEFLGRDVLISPDGLISVLLDGVLPEDNEDESLQEHVRLVTLNPRGVMFSADSYFNGEGTDAIGLLEGVRGQRIIIGATDMVHTIEDASMAAKAPEGVGAGTPDSTQAEAAVKVLRSRDGWLAAAVPTDAYDDPCVKQYPVVK